MYALQKKKKKKKKKEEHTCGDAKTCEKVVKYRPDGRLQLQRNPEGLDKSSERNTDDESDIQPVNMLVPVRTSDGGISNMDPFGIGSTRTAVRRFGSHDDGVDREMSNHANSSEMARREEGKNKQMKNGSVMNE